MQAVSKAGRGELIARQQTYMLKNVFLMLAEAMHVENTLCEEGNGE